ncbi:MAG: hypothetical protein J0L52_05470 [Caulobacterales bacterium]|nr:hypothetical protein [Caulobacterales bacterium]
MTALHPQDLSAEDQAVLRRLAQQPAFFEMAAGLFKGGNAWPTLAMMTAEIGLFIGGVWCAWRFGQAGEVIEALRWGLPALGMILMSITIKFAFWPVMHIHRLKRQVAELELRLTRGAR